MGIRLVVSWILSSLCLMLAIRQSESTWCFWPMSCASKVSSTTAAPAVTPAASTNEGLPVKEITLCSYNRTIEFNCDKRSALATASSNLTAVRYHLAAVFTDYVEIERRYEFKLLGLTLMRLVLPAGKPLPKGSDRMNVELQVNSALVNSYKKWAKTVKFDPLKSLTCSLWNKIVSYENISSVLLRNGCLNVSATAKWGESNILCVGPDLQARIAELQACDEKIDSWASQLKQACIALSFDRYPTCQKAFLHATRGLPNLNVNADEIDKLIGEQTPGNELANRDLPG